MKILAFTDIHGSEISIKRISQKIKSERPDLLVCAGDISIFEHGIVGILKKLNRLGKKIIMVHGNHEDEESFPKYVKPLKNLIYIHGASHLEKDVLFVGYGGDGFSVIDRKFEKISKSLEKVIKSNESRKVVLLCHAPPYNTKLDKLVEGHCGNKSIRNFIEKCRIDLMLCGHLHENFGREDWIKKTRLVNPGPFGKIIKI
jgi:uncharacterized protein